MYASGISFVILIPLLAAALIGLIAYLLYRRRLNAALSQSADASEEGGLPPQPRHRTASPAEFVPWLLVILLLVWNAISLAKISSQTQELQNINHNMAFYYQQLNSKLDHLGTRMEEAANPPIAEFDWSFSQLDAARGTGRLDITIIPKTPGNDTRYRLFWGGLEKELTPLPGGRFSVGLSFDWFKPEAHTPPHLVEEKGGVQRTQILEGIPCGPLWQLFMPCGEGHVIQVETKYQNKTLSIKGEVSLKLSDTKDLVSPTEINLVTELGGKVVETRPLSLSSYGADSYILDKTYENAEADASLRLYLDVKNDAGYTVRTWLMDHPASHETNEPEDLTGFIQIFDQDMRQVYGTNMGLIVTPGD